MQIRDSFDRALRIVLRGDYSKKDGFVSVQGENLSTVRSPNPRVANSIRSIDEIPSGEIDLAVLNLLHDAMNATADELIVRISRLFGWALPGMLPSHWVIVSDIDIWPMNRDWLRGHWRPR